MILGTLLRVPIRFYQLFLSPLTGANCRFEPTCSHYALEAIDRHGPFRGTGLAFRRILRCNPWHQGGLDPVPPPPHASRRERSAR